MSSAGAPAVFVVGSHMFRFGRYPDRSIKDMTAEVVRGALDDAGLGDAQLDSAWFSNSNWGRSAGQHCIRGQVALRHAGIGTIPVVNVENACAGGSSAFHAAWLGVASGAYDCALAVGVEKIFHPDKLFMFAGFLSGLDVGELPAIIAAQKQMEEEVGISPAFPTSAAGPLPGRRSRKKRTLPRPLAVGGDAWRLLQNAIIMGKTLGWDTLWSARGAARGMAGGGGHSPFMDVYSVAARHHMKTHGSTIEQLAIIAAKNHHHSVHNPLAQYQFDMTPEQVLADRRISYPLTRAMCAPIGDGGAAAILCSERFLASMTDARPVRVRASVLGSGRDRAMDEEDIGARVGRRAYHQAGVGPEDIDLAELHDATAFGELHHCETLGFCGAGEGGVYAESGATALGGARPINTSGGLESRGHPIGASGLAQLHEVVCQLRGEAGPRQVDGARLGLTQNGGGAIGVEEAAMCVHILESCKA